MTSTTTTMTDSAGSARAARGLLAAAALALTTFVAGCGESSKHATDGDTGAAAPATVRDMSATPQLGDSTAGVANPTGGANPAGDTLGARGLDPNRPGPGTTPSGRPATSEPAARP